MKLKKLRVVAAVAVGGLLATMAPFATNAFAADEPTWSGLSDGPIYLMDNGTALTVDKGTQLAWDVSNGLVATSIPITGDIADLDATRLAAPTQSEDSAIAFISPEGSEKTRSAWKSYGDVTSVDSNGLLLGAIWPAHIGYGAPAAVKAAGGTYSMGWAYLAPGNPTTAAVTKAYYTTINVDPGSGTWKFATPVAGSTTTLSVPATANVGDNVTLTATVAPAAASGTVTFKDGSTTLGTGTLSGGTATYSTSALAAGSHTITAVYGGGGGYAGSTSAASTITVASVVLDTTVSLSASAASVEAGIDVVLTASVTPASAIGNVEFFEGTTSLGTGSVASGSATKTINQNTAGSHVYTAKFVANASYHASAASNEVTVAWIDGGTPPVPKAPSVNSLVAGNGGGVSVAIGTDDVIWMSGIPAADNGRTVNVFAYSTGVSPAMFLGQLTISGVSLSVNGSGLPAGSTKLAIVTTDGTVLAWSTFTKTTAAGNSFSKPINAVVQTQHPADGEFSLKDLSGTASIELTNPVQTTNGSLSSAKLGKLMVTDLRQVSKPGWNLTTTVGTFTRQGGTDTIANTALGIAPSLVKQAGTGATAPTLASALAAGSGSFPYLFATVAGGGWSGQSTYDADLSFLAPSSAPAGTYSSTLTMTLVSK